MKKFLEGNEEGDSIPNLLLSFWSAKVFILHLIAFVLLAICLIKSVRSQTEGNIQLTAVMGSSISLKLEETNIAWEFKGLSNYEAGFMPVERQVRFRVASTHDWGLKAQFSPFINEVADTMNIRNFTLRIELLNTRDYKTRISYPSAPREGRKLSGVFVGSYDEITLIHPGPQGNRGDYDINSFDLRVGLGRWQQYTGLPPILDQKVHAGVYSGTLTITAYAEF